LVPGVLALDRTPIGGSGSFLWPVDSPPCLFPLHTGRVVEDGSDAFTPVTRWAVRSPERGRVRAMIVD
jgi:hypothetical protein